MLILAGIVLSLTIGENGIIARTKLAKDEYEKSQLKEELELEILNIEARKIAIGKEMTREDLKELEYIGATVINTDIPAQGEYKNHYFEIDENYKVTILDKIQGEIPKIWGEIITTGVIEEGGTVEIKVTASMETGTIQSIEPTNGAILKNTNNTDTQKIFEVSQNGTYYFKAIANNGRSAIAEVEVNIIQEKPQISITNVKEQEFTIEVTNQYQEGLVTEYRYYIENTKRSEGIANKEYTVTGLEENTQYTNIYVEAIFSTGKIASAYTTVRTLPTKVNPPKVDKTGFIPVTINDNGNITTVEESDENWYNYSSNTKHWANAKTKDNSLWVWIPRFAYKITYTNSNDKSQGGTIDIVFLQNITNKDFKGNDVTSNNYVDAKGKTGSYIVHPSFQNGSETGKNNGYENGEWDQEITGFWMAKFEAGYTGNAKTPNSAVNSEVAYKSLLVTGQTYERTWDYYGTRYVGDKIKYPIFQANRPSVHSIIIGDVYNLCKNLTANNNPYGFTTKVDSHLTKNSEWGAVAYLTYSKYGTNGEEVRINNVSANDGTNMAYAVTGYGALTQDAKEDTSRNLTTLMSSGKAGSWTTRTRTKCK